MLLVLAGLAKMLFGFLGAWAGRLPVWEAATVGVGLSLKGGTDVVVAIVGTELLLLPSDLYTTYAVVAILTVIVTPPLMGYLAAKTRPGETELKRLNSGGGAQAGLPGRSRAAPAAADARAAACGFGPHRCGDRQGEACRERAVRHHGALVR